MWIFAEGLSLQNTSVYVQPSCVNTLAMRLTSLGHRLNKVVTKSRAKSSVFLCKNVLCKTFLKCMSCSTDTRRGVDSSRLKIRSSPRSFKYSTLLAFTADLKSWNRPKTGNRTAHISHQCRKTTVSSCHRCQLWCCKNELHLNID